MPAINFKLQFANLVEYGNKRQTIRSRRGDGRDPRPGQTLYLYTGMRTKSCRRLGEYPCKRVSAICIDRNMTVVVGVKDLSVADIDILARDDGFTNSADFFDFFEKAHGLPFYGFLIEW